MSEASQQYKKRMASGLRGTSLPSPLLPSGLGGSFKTQTAWVIEQLTAVTIPTSDPGETNGHVDGHAGIEHRQDLPRTRSKSTTRAGNGVVEDKGLANDLVKLIVDCNLPFNIVDNPTFKTFLATWVPAMPVPSRDQ
ncbi:hypothetical protein HaLaN_28671, partial [Haematococcus lacustris]